ncbi:MULTISPECIES: response regulator [unclassified Blastococcus]
MTGSADECERCGDHAAATPIRVLVVDDHAGFREMLTEWLSYEEDIDVVGECEDGSQVLRAAQLLRPDVVLMDLSMPVMDGVEATRVLRTEDPEPRVVVLTADGPAAVQRATDAGAHALVSKDAPPEDLLSCIRAVSAGCTCCPCLL